MVAMALGRCVLSLAGFPVGNVSVMSCGAGLAGGIPRYWLEPLVSRG